MKHHFLAVPKVQMILALSAIFLSGWGYVYHFSWWVALFAVSVMSVTFLTDFLILRLKHQPQFPLWAALVTGFIISLIVTPTFPVVGVAAGILAMVSKHYLRIGQRHIFNPAAIGIFMSTLLFRTHPSWWGVSFQDPGNNLISFGLFVTLLLPALISMLGLRRQRIGLTFLGFYFVLSILLHVADPDFSLRSVFFGNLTVFFFSIVMLPEPMTSPNKSWRQFAYGVLVAGLFIVSGLPLFRAVSTVVPDFLLLSLLIGNVVFSELFLGKITESL